MELVMMDVLERKSPLRFHNLWHFIFYLASQKHVTIIQRYEPYNNTRKLTQKCARLSCKTVLTVLVRIVQTGQNISHFEIVRYCANCTKYLNWLNRLNFELTEIIVSMYQLKIWKSIKQYLLPGNWIYYLIYLISLSWYLASPWYCLTMFYVFCFITSLLCSNFLADKGLKNYTDIQIHI